MAVGWENRKPDDSAVALLNANVAYAHPVSISFLSGQTAMPKASEIKKNHTVEYDGRVYFVRDIERSVPRYSLSRA